MTLEELLQEFQSSHQFVGHCRLGMAIVVTRRAKLLGLPLPPEALLTTGRDRVAGFSGHAVNRILHEHNFSSLLKARSCRTGRGTANAAKGYLLFLDQLRVSGRLDLNSVESWWVDRMVDYFNSKPFTLDYDASRTLRSMIENLLDQAVKRQKESPGTSYVGAVLQHLIGAKLSLALPDVAIEHHGFSVADSVSGRTGDFVIDDAAIHCTTAPSEALLTKCQANLQAEIRPIVLTVGRGVEAAEVLAENKGISGRVEIMDAIQFLATNLYEFSLFRGSHRRLTMERLAAKYNEIVEAQESDPSLRIAVS